MGIFDNANFGNTGLSGLNSLTSIIGTGVQPAAAGGLGAIS